MKIQRKPRATVRFNTTAMPDIIFMLLFFFMVTTVVSSNELKMTTVPEVNRPHTLLEREDQALRVVLSNANGNLIATVDQLQGRIDQVESMVEQAIQKRKSQGTMTAKVVAWIDGTVSLSQVNQLKNTIGRFGIRNIEFVHTSCPDC